MLGKKMVVLFVATGLSILACSPPADQADEGMESGSSAAEDRAALDQLAVDFDAAIAAGDVDALMATYGSDPVALPPGSEPVRGARAVREQWSAFLAQGEVTTENTVVSSWVSGDLGGAWGTWTSTVEPEEGETIEDAGKFMFIARRQADGSWKSAANIWNSDTEPMPMEN